jgi:hypothetical protein
MSATDYSLVLMVRIAMPLKLNPEFDFRGNPVMRASL